MAKNLDVDGFKYRVNGWRPEVADHRDRLLKAPLFAWPLPTKADLTEVCTYVEDQGDLGSCTACSSTSAVEVLYKKANKPIPQLSKLFVYFATRVWIEKTDSAEDTGAYIRDVMKALVRHGACEESLWPYNTGMFSKEPTSQAQDNAKARTILAYQRCVNLRSTLRSIADGYPVVGGFSVPASMMTPAVRRTGVVPYPEPKEEIVGGHAVLFMGYNMRKKQIKFINSWGASWGDKGFGYLPFSYITNGLADDFWTIRTVVGL